MREFVDLESSSQLSAVCILVWVDRFHSSQLRLMSCNDRSPPEEPFPGIIVRDAQVKTLKALDMFLDADDCYHMKGESAGA
jgi:hypothetical protein